MILINKTFEIITPESAEDGEAAESGFVFKDVPHTFRELVKLLQEHPVCSSSHFSGTGDWFSSYPEQDYRTGEDETTAVHFSRENPPRMAKYWSKAARVAFPSLRVCRKFI